MPVRVEAASHVTVTQGDMLVVRLNGDYGLDTQRAVRDAIQAQIGYTVPVVIVPHVVCSVTRAPALLRFSPAHDRVIRLVAQGKPNKIIASELGLSEQTVKNHLRTIFRRVGVQSRTAAVLIVLRLGLAPGSA